MQACGRPPAVRSSTGSRRKQDSHLRLRRRINRLQANGEDSMALAPGRFDYAPITERPIIRWPGNARVAFWVAPNMEFFEYLPENRPTQPDIPHYSRMDYGNRVGFWRMLDVLNRHKVRACCCLNLEILDHFPEIRDAMVKADWDYMAHGLYNSRPIYELTEDQERAYWQDFVTHLKGMTGKRLKGRLGGGAGLHRADRRSDGRGGLSLSHVVDHRRSAMADPSAGWPEIYLRPLHRPDQRCRDARLEPGSRLLPADHQGPVRHALPRGRRERPGDVPVAAPAQYRAAQRGDVSRRGATLHPRP